MTPTTASTNATRTARTRPHRISVPAAPGKAWERLASDLDRTKLDEMTSEIDLDQVLAVAPKILEGQVRGRIAVRIR